MTTFNIVRKSNNEVCAQVATQAQAEWVLKNMGPQRNFYAIEEQKKVVHRRERALSDLSASILYMLDEKCGPTASCSKIAQCLVENGMFESQAVALKKVSDRCWLMEKQGHLVKLTKGVYRKAAPQQSVSND